MIIKPILKDFVRADGKSRVLIYCYDPITRTKVRIPTEFYVKPTEWDGHLVDKKAPSALTINPKLKLRVIDLENFASKHPGITPKQLQDSFKFKGQEHTPVTYFRHYIELCKKGEVVKKRSKENMTLGYLKAIGTSAAHLEEYAKKHRVDWDTLGEDFFDRYVGYLRGKNYKQNFIRKCITHLLTITRHAQKKGLHNNTVEYSMEKEKVQKIRLTPEEVEKIIDYDLGQWPELIPEQERFQVAYNLILRFGDTIELNEKNILERGGRCYLSAFTQKSKKEILLPLKASVYRILKKNKFKLKASNSKSNEKLKKIGLLAGITDKVTVTEFRNGKKSETVYKKYQLIETHTTRRSAARNLFDTGMAPEIIMTLGGWSNMKQLLEYIDIDLDYAASKAAEHPFFD